DKFSLTHELSYVSSDRERGFYNKRYGTNDVLEGILFSNRDRRTISNLLFAKYNFTNRSGFTFRVRHYWSRVQVQELYDLTESGDLQPTRFTAEPITHQNYNTFAVDAVYTWQFAPGSFFNLVWKDNVESFDSDIRHGYFRNFDQTVTVAPQNNNLSIKILYFLDYLYLKKKH
ncbi:MAG TPA: DUF5916 domain-containing protein, partial [Chitinophagaceae bacterium]|nr:DUF5916 domain-containing protein [Chitinophagaceae bacterium]